jgi:hypothetical protein
MTLAARIEGVGLVGPGLADWRTARAVLAGSQPYAPAPAVIPSPEALPATERRRAGKCVSLALAAGLAAAADAGRVARDLDAVFASSTGEGDNLHAICEALASHDRLISPTRFHNSVHNAPAGYWGIATGAMGASDSLAAFDGSFCAGLVEALGRLAVAPARPVLLVAYDAPYPEPLAATRPVVGAFGVGLVLVAALLPPPSGGRGGVGPVIIVRTTKAAHERMANAELERIRAGIPAARALPLLASVARGEAGRVVLEYLEDLALEVEVRP